MVDSVLSSRLFARRERHAAAQDGWNVNKFSPAARLSAGMAVMMERSPGMVVAVLIFRLLELNANVLLLAVLSWLIDPWSLGILFVLFWYLPAVHHVGSWKHPLLFPLLNFVVDDFSMFGLHPTPRPALRMYCVMLGRVLFLLAAMVLLAPPTSPLPESVIHFFGSEQVYQKFQGDELSRPAYWLWAILFSAVIVLTLVWILIVLHMLLVHRCHSKPSPIAGQVSPELPRVKRIATEVDEANQIENNSECRRALALVKERCPTFMLTNIFNTFGPMMGFLSRLGAEIWTCVTFFQSGNGYSLLSASLLAITLLITAVQLGLQRPNPFYEAKRCWDRGLYTKEYLAIIRADKGAQALPALMIKIYGLPFVSTEKIVSIAVAWGGIIGTIAVVSLFIFQQFDLGIETDGFDGNQPHLDDVARLGFAADGTPTNADAATAAENDPDVATARKWLAGLRSS